MNVLEARRRLLGRNVYKKTVEGNPAIAQGSLARRYPKIEMQGWTEQPQYEGKNLFDASKITNENVEVSENNLILKSYACAFGSADLWMKPSTQYTISAIRESTSTASSGGGVLLHSTGEKDPIAIMPAGTGARTYTFTTPSDLTDYNIYMYGFNDGNEYVISNFMLNEGSTALPYEPYTGGQPSPSPDYPQPITSAGKYNEDTQKWEYEITIANEQTDPDKNQTVTLTSDRPLTKWNKLEKRNGQWGWVYKSAEIVLDGSKDENWGIYSGYSGFQSIGVLPFIGVRREGFSEDIIVKTGASDLGLKFEIWLGVANSNIYVVRVPQFDTELPDNGLQNWRDWLAENPLTILTYLDEETFVPLTESEQEAMNALHTYRPTTVLSNQQGCQMALTYKTRKSLEVTE